MEGKGVCLDQTTRKSKNWKREGENKADELSRFDQASGGGGEGSKKGKKSGGTGRKKKCRREKDFFG